MSDTSWFLSPVSTVSASNRREHDLFMARTHEKKKKQKSKETLAFLESRL